MGPGPVRGTSLEDDCFGVCVRAGQIGAWCAAVGLGDFLGKHPELGQPAALPPLPGKGGEQGRAWGGAGGQPFPVSGRWHQLTVLVGSLGSGSCCLPGTCAIRLGKGAY